MKTKLIALTILTLLAATPLTYARGGPGFGGGHFGGGHFGGFRGGHSFSSGNRFYGGGNRFYTGGRQYYGAGRGYYGRRNWTGHYGRRGDWSRYHYRRHRGNYYYSGYANGWWLWPYGYYDGGSYPYDSYVYYDDSDDQAYRRSNRKYYRRGDRAGR